MIYIATTTINKSTEALRRFDKSKNCKVIIALDNGYRFIDRVWWCFGINTGKDSVL